MAKLEDDEKSKQLLLLISETKTFIANTIKRNAEVGGSSSLIEATINKEIDSTCSKIKKMGKDYEELAVATKKSLAMYASTIYITARDTMLRCIKSNDKFEAMFKSIKRGIDGERKKQFVFDYSGNKDSNYLTKFIETSGETGYSQMFIEDYHKRIDEELSKTLSMTNPVTYNKAGKPISLRNKAEMTVRYELVRDEIGQVEGEIILVSQHMDASLRCAPWQGRLYKVDVAKGEDVKLNKTFISGPTTALGSIDGKMYYSLKEAMQNGLFSYNCRHRTIKYQKGMDVPRRYNYNSKLAEEKRAIDLKMRQYERTIRMYKERQVLADNPTNRKYWQKKSKDLFKEYSKFADKHERVRNDWRCSISRVEREVNDKVYGANNNKAVINSVASEKKNIIANNEIEENTRLTVRNEFEEYVRKYPAALTLNNDKQNRHMLGTREREEALSNDWEKSQLKQKAFLGKSPLIKNIEWFRERIDLNQAIMKKSKAGQFYCYVDFGEIIGYTNDGDNSIPFEDTINNYPYATSEVKVHISQTGYHVVPVRRENKNDNQA